MANKVKDKGKLKVWFDGRIIDYRKAVVPILTHSLQYGSGIFEGIRSYETDKGAAIFRLHDHVKRFMNSMKIYSITSPYGSAAIEDAIKKVVKANGLKSSYIRPFAFYNDDNIGLGTSGKKISVYIAAMPFGAYFGSGKDKGIRCKVSSWHRINSDILPVQAKASGNYLNSIIAGNDAKASGFDEAILLSGNGYVAEGPGENIFLVKDNVLITPDKASDVLLGITRHSLLEIAEDMGFTTEERMVKREELYTADELFFAGTAAEVTPIVNVDGIEISKRIGPITKALADKYYDIVHGKDNAFKGWLTYV
ncbi:Branched-chain amino acid aminotransferase I [mine drainage metagenome]|uniref:branched-chain-amino-acid transaminase n=1 Tax=mine drainage metagenome TaxID=410659 RepID=T0ZJ77_9ZZZZ